MKKIITALLLSSVCITPFAKELVKSGLSTSIEKSVITIKISHVVGAAAPKGKATERFKEIMEKKFPGRVKVELYHNNTLFKDKEETEALELGVVDVILPTLGKSATEYGIKELGVFDLPFLFSSDDDVKKYIVSAPGLKLLNIISDRDPNIQGIAYWPNAFRSFSGPIPFKSPADFKNYAFRIESDSMGNFYQALGAKQMVKLAFADLPKALKKEGEFKLDGAENPLSNFWGSKLFESQKVLTLSRHSYNGYIFLTNKYWLSTLPADVREAFISAAKEAGEYGMNVSLAAEDKLLKDIEAKGVQIYRWTPEEKKRFKLAAIPVHEKFMKTVNKDFLLESYKAVR